MASRRNGAFANIALQRMKTDKRVNECWHQEIPFFNQLELTKTGNLSASEHFKPPYPC